jgi:hypothetical protein
VIGEFGYRDEANALPSADITRQQQTGKDCVSARHQ